MFRVYKKNVCVFKKKFKNLKICSSFRKCSLVKYSMGFSKNVSVILNSQNCSQIPKIVHVFIFFSISKNVAISKFVPVFNKSLGFQHCPCFWKKSEFQKMFPFSKFVPEFKKMFFFSNFIRFFYFVQEFKMFPLSINVCVFKIVRVF